MSTIYTDGAGNNYLGDCQWANHDINYPTTNYLSSIVPLVSPSDFKTDMIALLQSKGFTSVTFPSNWIQCSQIPRPANGATISYNFMTATSPSGVTFRITSSKSYDTGEGGQYRITHRNQFFCNNSLLGGYYLNGDAGSATGDTQFFETLQSTNTTPKQYIAGAFAKGFYFLSHELSATKNSYLNNHLCIFTELDSVNANFNYYSSASVNRTIILYFRGTATTGLTVSSTGSPTNVPSYALHFIGGVGKTLLQTGDAIYPISCSDGQTPGSQWATQMHVFDNNATLGFPRIGTVPNMLLGIGTYTYLKPAKITGTVFPDGGSPWYLPVGTYAGKTLLMRCYSSQT